MRNMTLHSKVYEQLIEYNHVLTLLISLRNLSVISVFLGFISCPIIESISCPPCGLALAESKSCNVTSLRERIKLS